MQSLHSWGSPRVWPGRMSLTKLEATLIVVSARDRLPSIDTQLDEYRNAQRQEVLIELTREFYYAQQREGL